MFFFCVTSFANITPKKPPQQIKPTTAFCSCSSHLTKLFEARMGQEFETLLEEQETLEAPVACNLVIGIIWVFPKIMVPPNHPILIGISIINHPFWGFYPYFWSSTHMVASSSSSSQSPAWCPDAGVLTEAATWLQKPGKNRDFSPWKANKCRGGMANLQDLRPAKSFGR